MTLAPFASGADSGHEPEAVPAMLGEVAGASEAHLCPGIATQPLWLGTESCQSQKLLHPSKDALLQ